MKHAVNIRMTLAQTVQNRADGVDNAAGEDSQKSGHSPEPRKNNLPCRRAIYTPESGREYAVERDSPKGRDRKRRLCKAAQAPLFSATDGGDPVAQLLHSLAQNIV